MTDQEHRATVVTHRVTVTTIADLDRWGNATAAPITPPNEHRYAIQCLCATEVAADTLTDAHAALASHIAYESRKVASEVTR